MLYGTEAGLSSIALLAKGQVSLDVLLDIKGQANQNISVMTPVTLFGSFFQKKKSLKLESKEMVPLSAFSGTVLSVTHSSVMQGTSEGVGQ